MEGSDRIGGRVKDVEFGGVNVEVRDRQSYFSYINFDQSHIYAETLILTK